MPDDQQLWGLFGLRIFFCFINYKSATLFTLYFMFFNIYTRNNEKNILLKVEIGKNVKICGIIEIIK